MMQQMFPPVKVYGSESCDDTTAAMDFLDENEVAYDFMDDSVPENNDFILKANDLIMGRAEHRIPVIRIGEGRDSKILVNPSIEALEMELFGKCSVDR